MEIFINIQEKERNIAINKLKLMILPQFVDYGIIHCDIHHYLLSAFRHSEQQCHVVDRVSGEFWFGMVTVTNFRFSIFDNKYISS